MAAADGDGGGVARSKRHQHCGAAPSAGTPPPRPTPGLASHGAVPAEGAAGPRLMLWRINPPPPRCRWTCIGVVFLKHRNMVVFKTATRADGALLPPPPHRKIASACGACTCICWPTASLPLGTRASCRTNTYYYSDPWPGQMTVCKPGLWAAAVTGRLPTLLATQRDWRCRPDALHAHCLGGAPQPPSLPKPQ